MHKLENIVAHSRDSKCPMSAERQQLIRSLFEKYINMYSSRDEGVRSFFSENFSGYAGSSKQLITDQAQLLKAIEQDFAQIPECIGIDMLSLCLQDLADNVVVATGFLHIHLPVSQSFLSQETARLVLVFRYEQTEWKIVHGGLSIPFESLECDEMYPVSAIEQRNRELEQLIVVRTQELEQANQLLQIRSNTDCLTQISNRRYFDSMLEQEWNRGQRSKSELSIIMLDIDYFKRFNDHYGHVEGDSCLQELAQKLQASLTRAGDVVARYGGEEFVVLLPNTDKQAALTVAKHLQEAIASLAIPHAESSFGIVTVSFGIASLIPSDLHSAVELVKFADSALYNAKLAGRNCIEVHEYDVNDSYL